MDLGGRVALLTDQAVGEYQTVLRRAVIRACRDRGLDALMYVGARVDAHSKAQRARNFVYGSILDAGVAGVLVAGGLGIDCGRERFAEFCAGFAPLPVCLIGTTAPGQRSVGVDDTQGMFELVDHLIGVHGRRRVAFVSGPRGLSETLGRYQGYVRAHELHGLEVDPRLLLEGAFSVESGYSAAKWLFEKERIPADAVAAANDNMAFGVIAALREMGLRVPDEVAVTGFDDSPASRTARPGLSTSRQPLLTQARMGVELLASSHAAGHYVTPPTMIQRGSCGCGYRVGFVRRRLSIVPGLSALDVVTSRRGALVESVVSAFEACLPQARAWAQRTADALVAELQGKAGAFLGELGRILEELHADDGVVEDLYAVIGHLADRLQRADSDREQDRIETMWQQALLLIGDYSTRILGRERMEVEATAARLQHIGERLTTSLGDEALQRVLASELPTLGISDALIARRLDDDRLVPWFALQRGERLGLAAEPYERTRLCPPGFVLPRGTSSVVTPLTVGEEVLGLAVFAVGEGRDIVYDSLRDHLSAGLKLAALHHEVVQETVLRQQAEQQRLQKELEIAQRIQAQVLPRDLRVPGLELTATMLSATEVGGDYYDVHPDGGGAWIGVGDVAGHGLPAGLVMLVIQSAVASLVQATPDAPPSELVSRLNRAVVEGVRGRLGRDEHATLMLARYEASGRITFAGAHEDVIVYRAALGRCEMIPTVGTWIGVLPDISDVTPDSELQLEQGDVIVFYSDGVTEAFNAQRQQFGPERICAVVEQLRDEPVERIRDGVVSAVQAWMDRQRDDITLMVGRYRGESRS